MIKKKWKKVFLNDQDVEILKNWWIQEDYEIITSNPKESTWNENTYWNARAIDWWKNFKNLYEDSLRAIEKKDDIIKDLSYRLWKAEIELKNSIPMLEYKKTTFLLEASNNRSDEEKKEVAEKMESLKERVRTQELINIIMVWLFTIMTVIVFLVWFANI